MSRCYALVIFALLAACQPPRPDNAAQRIELADAKAGPSAPMLSPDTKDAIWSPYNDDRLLFGVVGNGPLLSLECIAGADAFNQIRIIRHMAADAEAEALFAFVGNGTRARIPMDATWRGNRWRWEGEIAADSPDLDAITGSRALTATMPGGGMLELPGSPTPGRFIARCRGG